MPVALLALDRGCRVVSANTRARAWFGLDASSIGLPLAELPFFDTLADLEPSLALARREDRPIELMRVAWAPVDAGALELLVRLTALHDGESRLGTSVVVEDVSALVALQREVGRLETERDLAVREAAASLAELQDTSTELRAATTELGLANDQLQALTDELQQVTGRSLREIGGGAGASAASETGSGDPLVAQLRRLAADEVVTARQLAASLLASLGVAALVLDARLDVQAWNHDAEKQWELGADALRGRNALLLDTGIPAAELQEALRLCATGAAGTEASVAGVDPQGRVLAVTCRRFAGRTSGPAILVLAGVGGASHSTAEDAD